MTFARSLIPFAALLAGPRAQEPTPLERFEALPETDRSVVLRAVERRIQLDPDDTVQAIVSQQRQLRGYPEAKPPQFHDPEQWAPGAAPKRRLIRAGTPEHDAVRARIPRLKFLPDLRREVFYDWGQGKIVRRAEPLSDVEVFANLLNGFAPASDHAIARVLAALDRDESQRAVARYLGHLYADLNGRAYEGITLYEAWFSGEIVDIPDVDAIPFAVQILRTRSFRSPIPPGRRRTRLYQQIRERTFEHRKYRTLREAAAAAFVRAEPVLEADYALLVPRFHYLYAVENNDIRKAAERIAALPDRKAFIAAMDQAVRGSQEAYRLREQRKQTLDDMAARIRALALDALNRRQ